MFFRMIRNDALKSKAITLITIVFVTAGAMLVSLAGMLVVNLAGAIDTLMTQAKTPHFMQMHSGTVDATRLAAFARQNADVDRFQTLEFLNIDSARIVINGKSLAGSVQDNGVSTQSAYFDYLLDLSGNVIDVSDGEIYVPICYMKDGTAKVGDKTDIGGIQFTVAGFLRDSQMNSLLASSKRFLVSNEDYSKLRKLGSLEYLIEFRLKDLSTLGRFETAYTAAGLEANGPTITYPLFRTLNAISDGLMITVILLVSILVVAIAFMCIRFTLLAKIEDDYREIGVMKAIGLRVSDIKRVYLAKYAAIAAVGSVTGLSLSFAFKGLLLEDIRLYMGESTTSSLAVLFGIIGVLAVFSAIIAYVNNVLNRFKQLSAADAIRFGTSQEKTSSSNAFCLSSNRLIDTRIFLGIKDVLSRRKIYGTMLAVLVISAFILIVPQNMYNTISSKGFITYLGIGRCDMRIDIQQTANIPEKADRVARSMSRDGDISRYAVLTTRTFRVKTDHNSEDQIKIELGDHSIFPVRYSEGRAPSREDEIAISKINADELGKKLGDTITLIIGGKAKNLSVSGIYSDVTNGGKTAKAVFSSDSAEVMWSVICAEFTNKSLLNRKVPEYRDRFDFAKVSSIDEYITQTFGSTLSSVKKASWVAIAIAVILTILVTLLFIKMLVAKDRYSIAIMKAFGFTSSDITTQYLWRSSFVMIIGVVVGTLLANSLGEMLAGMVISSLGASSFEFIVNPFSAYLLSPLTILGAVLIATLAGTSNVNQIKISENIKG